MSIIEWRNMSAYSMNVLIALPRLKFQRPADLVGDG